MDAKELNANPFLGRTQHLPRPVGPADGKFGVTGRADLLRDQQRWDQAKAWGEDNDRLRAERLAAIETARQAERDARWREAAEVVLEALRSKYLASDPSADEASFQADLPEIRHQVRG